MFARKYINLIHKSIILHKMHQCFANIFFAKMHQICIKMYHFVQECIDFAHKISNFARKYIIFEHKMIRFARKCTKFCTKIWRDDFLSMLCKGAAATLHKCMQFLDCKSMSQLSSQTPIPVVLNINGVVSQILLNNIRWLSKCLFSVSDPNE